MNKYQEIRKLCATYLNGPWEQFCEDIVVNKIEAGFSNKVYRCSLASANPSDVIVKVFGSELSAKNSMKINGVTGELVEHLLLSVVGIAPKLLAAFDTGRIEEYVKGRNITNEDFFKDNTLLIDFAKILAYFHSQKMPVCKQIIYNERILKKFINFKLGTPISEIPEKIRPLVQSLFDFPIKDEIEWLIKNATSVNSRVVFAHNDIVSGNIIFKDENKGKNNRLLLIDYELAGYNYRGFDIAHFFTFLCYRIYGEEDKIVYAFDGDLNPSIERMFLEEYLKETRKYDGFNEEYDNYDHLVMEINFFKLLALIAAIGYGRKLVSTPSCFKQMESQDYIVHLLSGYKKQKELLIKNYPSYFIN